MKGLGKKGMAYIWFLTKKSQGWDSFPAYHNRLLTSWSGRDPKVEFHKVGISDLGKKITHYPLPLSGPRLFIGRAMVYY